MQKQEIVKIKEKQKDNEVYLWRQDCQIEKPDLEIEILKLSEDLITLYSGHIKRLWKAKFRRELLWFENYLKIQEDCPNWQDFWTEFKIQMTATIYALNIVKGVFWDFFENSFQILLDF